jgi:hypothetical protein
MTRGHSHSPLIPLLRADGLAGRARQPVVDPCRVAVDNPDHVAIAEAISVVAGASHAWHRGSRSTTTLHLPE